jgi:hypothetical protein
VDDVLRDLLKNNSANSQIKRFPQEVEVFYTYIKNSLASNKPYDQLTRELITVTDARSITGTATFNGSGGYSFSGQQVVGSGSAAAYTSNGTYTLTAAGLVTLTNPQRASLTVNARYGAEAVAGSSTEAQAGTVDLFIAIPAPATTTKVANSSLSGTYYAADFELPAASMAQVRNAWVCGERRGGATAVAERGGGDVRFVCRWYGHGDVSIRFGRELGEYDSERRGWCNSRHRATCCWARRRERTTC